MTESEFPTFEGELESLLDLALQEDLGPTGDITSQAVIPPHQLGEALILAKEPLILCGVPLAEAVFKRIDPEVSFTILLTDGTHCSGDRDVVARVAGRLRSLLAGERLALNFLQHLSGIATLTSRYAAALEGLSTLLTDTRKSTPGLRGAEKYAVRVGGGHNHRMGLFDGVLIKDNHLAVAGSVAEAVARAQRGTHPLIRIQVEVESMADLQEAAAAGADRVLLDNMDLDLLRACVAWARIHAPGLKLEASGGVRLDTVRAIAETGVHQVSAGSLIHQATWVDLSLDVVPMFPEHD